MISLPSRASGPSVDLHIPSIPYRHHTRVFQSCRALSRRGFRHSPARQARGRSNTRPHMNVGMLANLGRSRPKPMRQGVQRIRVAVHRQARAHPSCTNAELTPNVGIWRQELFNAAGRRHFRYASQA
jgi:hypothetical protein